jgi:hypothetical protein
VKMVMKFRFCMWRGILWLSNYQLLKKCSPAWNWKFLSSIRIPIQSARATFT